MSHSFERLKYISIPIKDLINGYIRRCQIQLFGDIANTITYYNIPELINIHCILFYDIFTWYRKKHGNGIEFISDTEVKMNQATDKSNGRSDAVCMLATKISNQFCDQFSITFKSKSFAIEEIFLAFDIGYVVARDGLDLEESVKDWNHELGSQSNKDTSFAFSIYNDELYYMTDSIAHYLRDIHYSLGDSISLLFDFQRKVVWFYHNYKVMDCRSINGDAFWIGLCLMKKDTIIEMVDYKFITQ